MADLRSTREGVVWIPEMLPRAEVVALLSAATVFACPSIYEPLGIVNLEAMACELPVVATATGGIPEVVVHGETGWLVPIEQEQDGSGTPLDAERFVADLAARAHRGRERHRARRRHGAGRAAARGRGVLVGHHRRADHPGLQRRAAACGRPPERQAAERGG